MPFIVPYPSTPSPPPVSPTLTAPQIQAVFADGALSVVVPKIQSFNTQFGISSPQTDAAAAGQASITFRDNARLLDPDSGSVLSNHLTPGGPTTVQLQVWNGTVWVPLFTGMIGKLDTVYPGGKLTDVTVTLVDPTRDLNLHIPAAGVTYPQQQTGARISALVGAQSRSAWGWINRAPSHAYAIDAGQKVLGSLTTDGQTSTWAYASAAALAERGILFFDQGAVLTFQDQDHRFRSSSPRWVFGDNPATEIWVEQSLGYTFSNDRMITDIAYTSADGYTSGYGPGGAFQYPTATAAQNNSQVTATDTELADMYQAAARARWEYERYSVNRRDAPQVDINAFGEWPSVTGTSRFGAALGVNLGDYVTLNRRPPTGATISNNYWVSQIQHNFTGGANPTWQTSFTLAFADVIFPLQVLGTTPISAVTTIPW